MVLAFHAEWGGRSAIRWVERGWEGTESSPRGRGSSPVEVARWAVRELGAAQSVSNRDRIGWEAKMWRGGSPRLSTAPTWRKPMPVTIQMTYRIYESLLREGRLRLEGQPCP